MLDPRISYEGLKCDYGDDAILSDHLEDLKINLFKYFDENYAALSAPTPSLPPPSPVQTVGGSPQKSFTARYRRKSNHSTNELEEYFKLPAEDFISCDPIQWWVSRRSQFPRLFQLARDVLCIPGEYLVIHVSQISDLSVSHTGSAVAVERIFSGGRDTISLRRASLQPNTIRTLMLVKKRLHLARAKATPEH